MEIHSSWMAGREGEIYIKKKKVCRYFQPLSSPHLIAIIECQQCAKHRAVNSEVRKAFAVLRFSHSLVGEYKEEKGRLPENEFIFGVYFV